MSQDSLAAERTRAKDPNTPLRELASLALEHAEAVLKNPGLSALAHDDPEGYESLLRKIARGLVRARLRAEAEQQLARRDELPSRGVLAESLRAELRALFRRLRRELPGPVVTEVEADVRGLEDEIAEISAAMPENYLREAVARVQGPARVRLGVEFTERALAATPQHFLGRQGLSRLVEDTRRLADGDGRLSFLSRRAARLYLMVERRSFRAGKHAQELLLFRAADAAFRGDLWQTSSDAVVAAAVERSNLLLEQNPKASYSATLSACVDEERAWQLSRAVAVRRGGAALPRVPVGQESKPHAPRVSLVPVVAVESPRGLSAPAKSPFVEGLGATSPALANETTHAAPLEKPRSLAPEAKPAQVASATEAKPAQVASAPEAPRANLASTTEASPAPLARGAGPGTVSPETPGVSAGAVLATAPDSAARPAPSGPLLRALTQPPTLDALRALATESPEQFLAHPALPGLMVARDPEAEHLLREAARRALRSRAEAQAAALVERSPRESQRSLLAAFLASWGKLSAGFQAELFLALPAELLAAMETELPQVFHTALETRLHRLLSQANPSARYQLAAEFCGRALERAPQRFTGRGGLVRLCALSAGLATEKVGPTILREATRRAARLLRMIEHAHAEHPQGIALAELGRACQAAVESDAWSASRHAARALALVQVGPLQALDPAWDAYFEAEREWQAARTAEVLALPPTRRASSQARA
jgi:hypothetical protein